MGKSLSKVGKVPKLIKFKHKKEIQEEEDYLEMGPSLIDSNPYYENLGNHGSLHQEIRPRLPTDMLPAPPNQTERAGPDSATYIYGEGIARRESTDLMCDSTSSRPTSTGAISPTEVDTDSESVTCVSPGVDSGFEDYQPPPCSDGLHALVNKSSTLPDTLEDDTITRTDQVPVNDQPPKGHFINSKLSLDSVPASSALSATSDSDCYEDLDSIKDSSSKYGNSQPRKYVKKIYNNCTFINFVKSSGVQVGDGGAMNYMNPTDLKPNNNASLQHLLVLIAQQLGLNVVEQQTCNGQSTSVHNESSDDDDYDEVMEFEVIETK